MPNNATYRADIDVYQNNNDWQLSLRISHDNPNHHLWNNNGTWFVHYTVCEPGYSGTRRRHSLRTDDLHEARQRRDRLFARMNVVNA